MFSFVVGFRGVKMLQAAKDEVRVREEGLGGETQ